MSVLSTTQLEKYADTLIWGLATARSVADVTGA